MCIRDRVKKAEDERKEAERKAQLDLEKVAEESQDLSEEEVVEVEVKAED